MRSCRKVNALMFWHLTAAQKIKKNIKESRENATHIGFQLCNLSESFVMSKKAILPKSHRQKSINYFLCVNEGEALTISILSHFLFTLLLWEKSIYIIFFLRI